MPSSERMLDRGFGDGLRWDERPLQKHLLLWILPLVGLLVGGTVVALTWVQAHEERALGYVVDGPSTCVVDLADRPGGGATHRVEQATGPRQTTCDMPSIGSKVYYDPETDKEASSPGNDRQGYLFAAGVVLLTWLPGILGW